MKNEPAFPSTSVDGTDQVMGMTLRDYFAAKFASVLLANMYSKASGVIGTNSSEYYISEQAYKIADAMLKERAKHESKQIT